ncbi:TVP38/TMEM64 family protein [Alkalicoccus daliensis]|uniref:TVP38/TMEM64 family membrane protein n=1 Tax=Alkalicoccus daliensis TaxID=745820 RepID=A0A1H0ADP9_9BACI|nr:VTT domain-containing protein [Alkalicoccus daliensis]SDN31444.1 Uncharacterized membrane protein YdjX, TVP38/TMEM64 family, SNARE-associated domain [Alkalicoccus daliensis]
MYKRWSIVLITIILIFLLWSQQSHLLNWLETNGENYILLTTVIATLLSLFPVIPYPIVGGIIGAAFGPPGAFIVWTGSTAASLIFFIMIRYGGFEKKGHKLLIAYKPIRNLTVLFERNAFLSITILRMIPIVPSIIINAYAGLSRIKFIVYAVASALGKIPSMLLFVLAGYSAVTDFTMLVYTLILYAIFLTVVYICYTLWLRKVTASNLRTPAVPKIDDIADKRP